jgi:hypothetical protein
LLFPKPFAWSAPRKSDPAAQAHQECNDGTDQEYDEQYFRDTGCADRDSAEPEKCSDQGYDEEDDGIMKHVRTSEFMIFCSPLRVAELLANGSIAAVGARRRAS